MTLPHASSAALWLHTELDKYSNCLLVSVLDRGFHSPSRSDMRLTQPGLMQGYCPASPQPCHRNFIEHLPISPSLPHSVNFVYKYLAPLVSQTEMVAVFGNSSNTTSWEPQPTHRGTFGLVSSCLITLFLCVWTALHLNIPEYGKAHMQKWHKLAWLVVGFFAPELVR